MPTLAWIFVFASVRECKKKTTFFLSIENRGTAGVQAYKVRRRTENLRIVREVHWWAILFRKKIIVFAARIKVVQKYANSLLSHSVH